MEKIRMMVTCCLLLIASGCATMEVIPAKDFSLATPLPKTIVIGEISLEKNVKLPQEEINKGREVLDETFKKELPGYQILMTAPEQGDYLEVTTRITLIRKSNPLMIAISLLQAPSLCAGNVVVSICRQNQPATEILKAEYPKGGGVSSGVIHGDYGAFHYFLEVAAQKIAQALKRHGINSLSFFVFLTIHRLS